jgi:hypothetical protein
VTFNTSKQFVPPTEPPLDFALFVAERRGLQVPDAVRLLVDWLATYQPRQERPPVVQQRSV